MVLFKFSLAFAKDKETVIDLHSNMVLFKLNCSANIFCQFSFTFQYGSIQIQSRESQLFLMSDLHSNMVLFK